MPVMLAALYIFLSLVMIGLLYMAYPDGCLPKFTFLPRLTPYPMRGHRLLCSVVRPQMETMKRFTNL